ncbi:DUF2917 domain-containing protein [Aquincola sp. MAHUQ-54]|uniref:DUF2917 domain-containing protein n=1 Tax=Aquincola agrisoli TaxID=3119538 RepID=A0AAW9QHV6_9BURK
MSTALMSFSQADAAAWSVALPAGTARRIAPARHARWLAVTEGQVWLTTDDARPGAGGDIWLSPGEGHALGAGVEAVVEGRAAAVFQLVEAPQPRTVPGRSAWQRLGGALEASRRSLQFGAIAPTCV